MIEQATYAAERAAAVTGYDETIALCVQQGAGKEYRVQPVAIDGILAVHNTIGFSGLRGTFTISHLPTGYMIVANIPAAATAVQCMADLNASTIPWERIDESGLIEADKAIAKAIIKRYQVEATV